MSNMEEKDLQIRGKELAKKIKDMTDKKIK